jgi:ABC-2 type transport system ATP-binding protein
MQIELKNVSKTIKNKKLLDDVSFLFETGDIIGFIGNNGAGKTTTIKTIFQEYNLTSGEILFNGKPIGSDDLRSNPRANSGDFEKLFSDLADALQLSDNLNSKFSQLSSGMQKRALLLFVLITQPNVLILDEPTANLDVQSRKEFIGLLKTLSDKMHFAIMITSHNIDELETFVNKIVFIKEGRIVLTKKFDRTKESLNELYEKYIATNKPIINEKKLEDIFKNSEGKNEK